MAFAAECRMVITAWLRPGSACDNNNVENFFSGRFWRFWASGIALVCCAAIVASALAVFLDLLESKGIGYVIPVRLLSTIRQQVSGIRDWLELNGLSSVAEFQFWATEAAFRLACFGYNLMSVFRQALLGAASKTYSEHVARPNALQ